MGRRRGGGFKEKARKKVTVKLIERMHAGQVTGPYRIMEKLIEKHHKHLKEAKIALAWRYGWKATTDGHTTLGQAKKGSDLDREMHDHDFVIMLNFERWNSGRVIAKGVKFQSSNKDEFGFGCRVVAVCDECDGQIVDEPVVDPRFTKLDFTGWEFQTQDRTSVESVKELDLDETGAVLAVL